jgi:translation initiation factor IF-1
VADDTLTMHGVVTEALRGGTFRVVLDDGGHEVLAQLAGRMRRYNIKVIIGDRVDVDVSVYDLARGRIIYRHK